MYGFKVKHNAKDLTAMKILALIIAIFLQASVFGQHPAKTIQYVPDTTKNKSGGTKTWSFTASLGGTPLYPAGDLEKAMVAARFNHTTLSATFYSGHAHPHSYPGGFSWIITANKEVKPYMLVGMVICGSGTGETDGCRDPSIDLNISYKVITVAPTISVNAGGLLRAGIGPALHFTQTSNTTNYIPSDIRSITKVGFLTYAGISFPTHTRLYLNLDFQYRYIGKVKIGPFEMTDGIYMAVFPETLVRFNYFCIAVGLGLRL
jgi:opacity protein-like surface antigen